jgi:hypothetical protein
MNWRMPAVNWDFKWKGKRRIQLNIEKNFNDILKATWGYATLP